MQVRPTWAFPTCRFTPAGPPSPREPAPSAGPATLNLLRARITRERGAENRRSTVLRRAQTRRTCTFDPAGGPGNAASTRLDSATERQAARPGGPGGQPAPAHSRLLGGPTDGGQPAHADSRLLGGPTDDGQPAHAHSRLLAEPIDGLGEQALIGLITALDSTSLRPAKSKMDQGGARHADIHATPWCWRWWWWCW